MTPKYTCTRRGFIRGTAATGAGTFLRLGAPALAAITQAACGARNEGTAFATLDVDDAGDLAAIAARILPTTDTPGADEAGVIHFIDQALGDAMAGSLDFVLTELANLNTSLGGRFAELDAAAQDAALVEVEDGPFFSIIYVMTLFGFFAMSRYGGNRNHVGWKLIGFDGHHGAWQYPFGHYDAEAMRSDADAG